MSKKWKKMLAFLLSLSFIFSAALPVVEAEDAPVERFSVPRNESQILSVGENWTHVNWKIHDPRTNREYSVGQGNALAVNYAMAHPLLHDSEVRLRAFGISSAARDPKLIGTYFVKFTEPVHRVEPPLFPKIAVMHSHAPAAQAASAPGGGARLLAEGDPVHLEVVYLYWDENNQLVMEDETHPRPIAPGWYLNEPDGTTSYTVTFHVIEGYKPYIQNDDGTLPTDSATTYTFTPENGAYAPEKITVVYVPQDVKYKVEIYQEKLDGGGYELYDTVTGRAKTGSQIDMDALCEQETYNPEGFEQPYYREKPRVKGDGTTVAKIYLDRQYFLMDFTLGKGGYGVEPVYKKFEARLSVGTPIRPGYEFLGWKRADENGNSTGDLISSEDMPETMPANNSLYIAQWEMNSPADVIVNIWGEEANTGDYELIASRTIQAPSDEQLTQEVINTALTGVDANLWTYEKTDPVPLPTVLPDGSTFVNVYYKRTLKTLTFNPVDSTMTKWVAGETKAEDWADGGTNSDHRPKWDEDYTWTYSQFMGGTKTINVQALQTYLNEHYPNPEEGQVVEYIYLAKKPGTWDDGKKTMHFVYHNGAWYVGEGQEVPAEPFYTITAKWGASIADKWDAACEAGSCHNWSENPNGDSPWTSGVRVMFDRNINFYKGSDSGGGTCNAYYYGEKVDGDGYELIYTATADGRNLIVSDEDRLKFEGFTYESGTSNGSRYNGAEFYYKRNTYQVIYVNLPNPNHEKDAKFEQSLNQAPYNNYTPECPSNLEPGVYKFEGWYKDPSLQVQMDWNMEMPAKNITVYAKWSPTTHDVTFRPRESDAIPEGSNATVAHGGYIPEDKIPLYERQGFDFVQWFYRAENGVEHAFKPEDMPVRSDMDLYAMWKARSQWSYTVNYLLEGTNTHVAEPTVGIGMPGDSFTVDAKHGYRENHPSELFWEYWQFFTPTAESIDVTLDVDKKEICFYYEEETAVINYVPVSAEMGSVSIGSETVGKVTGTDLQGSTPIPADNCRFVGWYKDRDCTRPVPETWVGKLDSKITPERTRNAGVPSTDRSTLWVFEDITYYAKFERIIEINYVSKTFNCNDDQIEDPPGGGVSPDKESFGETTGIPKGSTATAEPGFDFVGWYTDENCTLSVDSGWVDANDKITPQKTGDPALYQAATYYAKFKEQSVKINYEAVVNPASPSGTEIGGRVSPETETICCVTGSPQGSTATPESGYTFSGWYTKNEQGNYVAVSLEWITDKTTLTPQREDGLYKETTYYAMFSELPALKITKRIVGDFYSPDDIFVFTISKLDNEGNAAGAMNLTVRASEMAQSTNAGGKTVWETSVTLAALEPGEYSASEDTGWSWRYACSVTPTDGVVTLSVDDEEAVEIVFENTLENNKWLSCQCRAVNKYGENTVTFRENESDPIPTSGNMVVTVANGEQIPEVKIPAEPTKPGFEFNGWYYKKGENGTVTAFDPANDDVTCNMNLYATWSKQGGGP